MTTSFSGPKSSWNFRETGPWPFTENEAGVDYGMAFFIVLEIQQYLPYVPILLVELVSAMADLDGKQYNNVPLKMHTNVSIVLTMLFAQLSLEFLEAFLEPRSRNQMFVNSIVVLSFPLFSFSATLNLYMVRSWCPFLTLQLRCESRHQIEECDLILR